MTKASTFHLITSSIHRFISHQQGQIAASSFRPSRDDVRLNFSLTHLITSSIHRFISHQQGQIAASSFVLLAMT
jgi:hypothetical protein